MTEISRRSLLVAAGAAGASPLLGGRASAADAGLPYDYPIALPPPFAHGVASGDPLADRVILWTRLTLADPTSTTAIPVQWQAATDPAMTTVVASGSVTTDRSRDWTVKVDAPLPAPAATYYYRFSALGTESIVGRTRTAPAGDVAELRIAVVACSSYWSAHFNGYARIADRNDLDLVVHCGDQIYDFVDEDEWVRARNGRFDLEDVDFRDWRSIDEVRRRYALYYADPDLCRLHQQHPISILWDNHDIEPKRGVTRAQVLQVFWEWTPSRPPKGDGSGTFPPRVDGQVDPENTSLVYRQLAYGTMADVFFMDTQLIGRQPKSVPIATRELLGAPQLAWLKGALSASEGAGHRWRFVVNGWPLGQLKLANTPGGPTLPFPGPVRDGVQFYGAWDEYPLDRNRLLGHLRTNGIGDNLVVTGDAHGNFAWDLVEDPTLPVYNPVTGAGSVGVEFAPSSIGRGGADEVIAGMLYRATHGGSPPFGDRAGFEPLLPAGAAGSLVLEQALTAENLSLRFINWRDHGYGIVHLTAAEAVLEYWWQPILVRSPSDTLGAQIRVTRGTDHAVQDLTPTPTSGSRVSAPAPDGHGTLPAVVPEVGSPVLLGVAGAAAIGAAAWVQRRAAAARSSAPPAR